MRSTNFSRLAIMASLLAREAQGAPLDKRALVYVTDEVIVTEVRTVTAEADGSYQTGDGFAVGTVTIYGTPQVVQTPVVAPSVSAPIRDKATSAAAKDDSSGGVFVEAPPKTNSSPIKTTSTPVPTTPVSVVVPVAPATTSKVVPSSSPISVPEASTLVSIVTPVPSATSTPSTGGSTSSGNKRGLAYNDPTLLQGFVGSGSKASWCYNWGSTSGGTIPSGLEYVPMLWGLGDHVNGWKQTAQTAIDNGAKALLAFNEPDLAAQSNISPSDAATGYLANMQDFAGKALLGAPAVTNGGSPAGLTWLKSFLGECKTCTIDFVPIHWYDSATNFAYFKSYISDAHDAAGGRDLWITEFGASGSVDQQNTFLEQATAYLDSLDYVKRYAYFMVQEGGLVSGGQPSLLGKTFAGLS